MNVHDRFNKKVYAFKTDFTGILAKWLVKQSPYTVPANLSECIIKFNDKLDKIATFDSIGMAEIDLSTLTEKINTILESIPEIIALNESKNKNIQGEITFVSRYTKLNPDDDFIDIMALAQNITCELADEAEFSEFQEKKDTNGSL